MAISEKKQIEIMPISEPRTRLSWTQWMLLHVADENGKRGLQLESDDPLSELDPLSLHSTPESMPHTYRGKTLSRHTDKDLNMATQEITKAEQGSLSPKEAMRVFDSGATRDVDNTKFDYEGFFSPLVFERFAQYLTKHRVQADGQVRASDNWQKGIPFDVYMKSAWRHFMDWWTQHRGNRGSEDIEESICAVIFNAQGYLHERLKEKEQRKF